jgi:hypothetical protein
MQQRQRLEVRLRMRVWLQLLGPHRLLLPLQHMTLTATRKQQPSCSSSNFRSKQMSVLPVTGQGAAQVSSKQQLAMMVQ